MEDPAKDDGKPSFGCYEDVAQLAITIFFVLERLLRTQEFARAAAYRAAI